MKKLKLFLSIVSFFLLMISCSKDDSSNDNSNPIMGVPEDETPISTGQGTVTLSYDGGKEIINIKTAYLVRYPDNPLKILYFINSEVYFTDDEHSPQFAPKEINLAENPYSFIELQINMDDGEELNFPDLEYENDVSYAGLVINTNEVSHDYFGVGEGEDDYLLVEKKEDTYSLNFKTFFNEYDVNSGGVVSTRNVTLNYNGSIIYQIIE